MDLSRVEGILKGNKNIVPQSRVEQLLQDLVLGGGSIDYDYLASKIDILTEAEVEQIIQDYLAANPAASGDAVLSADLTANENVGGVKSGKFYAKGTALETIIRDILTSIKVPTLTNPSVSLAVSKPLVYEVGTNIGNAILNDPDVYFTVTLNRGSINPPYGTSGNRSGEAVDISWDFISNYGGGHNDPMYDRRGLASDPAFGIVRNGNKIVRTPANGTTKAFPIEFGTGYETEEMTMNRYGGQFSSVWITFDNGEQPKDSEGNDFDSAYSSNTVYSNKIDAELVFVMWSNSSDILTVSKEQIISKSVKTKTFSFPAQTKANPEIFDIPASWNITSIEAVNPITNQWVDVSSEFTTSPTTHQDAAGNTVNYTRYTYNVGIATGARDIRVKWS